MRIIKADVCAWMNLMNSVPIFYIYIFIYYDIFSPSLYTNKIIFHKDIPGQLSSYNHIILTIF